MFFLLVCLWCGEWALTVSALYLDPMRVANVAHVFEFMMRLISCNDYALGYPCENGMLHQTYLKTGTATVFEHPSTWT